MNQPVTFFYRRQSPEGRSYAFNLKSSTRVYRVLVYSRRPVEEAVVRSRDLLDYQQEIGRIMQAVGPGSVVVLTFEDERTRSFQVVPVSAAESSFGHFGVLRPGSEMALEEVKLDKWLETPAGSHLLVPVDREAEEHLRQFKGFLDGLPPDMESLILYSLRRPSLDARIRDLEAVRSKGVGGPINQIREWLVPALLILLLALNGVLLYRTFRPEQVSAAAGQGAQAQSPEEKKSEPKSEPVTAAYDEEVLAISQAVEGKAGSIADFQRLLDGHFKGLTDESAVAAALQSPDRAKPLVLGLMKLEALRLDARAASGLFGVADNPTAVKGFFRGRRLDSGSREMLAALACRAYGKPGLLATRDEALSFVEDHDCKEPPLDPRNGLEELLDFVEGYSPS